MVIAYSKGEAGSDNLIVFNPLHHGGRCFFLPRDALEQAWTGDALLLHREQTGLERTTTRLLWVLSICGFVARTLLLFHVFYGLLRY